MLRNLVIVFLLLGFIPSVPAAQQVSIVNAIRNNDLALMAQQLASGLDPDLRVKGQSLLVHAINANRIEMIKLLLSKKARFQDYIFAEVLKGNERALNRLLAAGTGLHPLRNKEGETLLMLSAREGHEDILATLVLKGADVNAQSDQGHSAMSYASRYGHLAIVKYLLNHGAEVNISNKNGWTPLLKAARGGHLEVVDYLLAHDADLRSRNSGGENALVLARRYQHHKVVKFLKDYQP